MAIAFVDSTRYTRWDTTATNLTGSIIVSAGSNRILLVGVVIQGGTISSVTWDGNAMTQVVSVANATPDQIYALYRYVAPDIKTANVVVTQSEADRISFVEATYTGVHQTSPVNVSNSGTGTGSASANLTTTIANCWLVASGLLTDAVTSFTGVTERETLSINTCNYGDSNAVVAAGANTISISGTGAGGIVSLAMTPAFGLKRIITI